MLTPVDPPQQQQVSIVSRVTSAMMNTNIRSLVSFNNIHPPSNCEEAIDRFRVNLHDQIVFYILVAGLIGVFALPASFTTCSIIYLLTLIHLWTQSGATLAETPFNRLGLLAVYTYIYVGLLIYTGVSNAALVFILVVTIFSFFHAACYQVVDQSTTQDVV